MPVTDWRALVTATITPNASIDTMLGDIASALRFHGVYSRLLPYAPAAPNEKLLHALVLELRDSGMPSFILDCNAKSDLVLEQRNGRVLTIHDGWNIPLVGFMVDHPACHMAHLDRAPDKALITAIDRRHLIFLKDLGLKATTLFCPHGGPPPVPEQRDTADREIDLLFIGNIDAEPPLDIWLDRASQGDAVLRGALAEAQEAVCEAGAEPYAALAAAFARISRDAKPAMLAPFIQQLDFHVARTRRLEVLEAIRSRRITILGSVAPEAAARLAHHDLKGPASFARALSLMARAKLLIDSRVTFAGGAHERVFYGLSRGTVAVTEPGEFLAPELAQGLGMVGLPRNAPDIDALIDGLVADPARIDMLRERGLPHYAVNHVWDERAGRILSALAASGLLPG